MENNMKAMREALESILNIAYEVKDLNADGWCRTSIPTEFVIDTIKSALAKPPRNCDVGTAEEQAQRFGNHCESLLTKDGSNPCTGCPCCGVVQYGRCEFAWAQMPYEEGENK